ncbi:putative thiol-disulfide interchange protein [Sphingomonas changbaiensis NBRC 104936]|uniref:Putative thiol-disulfide interchange protein n=1 Tax=Sphingomonas changbaiensis NBRC 104936 TaxID=1219043 RepID=A0A0E9MU25_9SPHN|nr:thioredoxin family protein [Sphingomonas changbaiensis]GAO40911.1 putative thiol-disulfide interchange protein [Sphingomonas changbaiensis NBRC 104936]
MLAKLKSAWAWLLLALLWPAAALAQPGVQHIHPRLVAESASPAPGQTVALALVMTPDKGWHGYWQNPGDAGVPADVKWQLPAGVNVGAFRYPVPGTLLVAGLMNYIYEREYALIAPLTVPKDAAPGTRLHVTGDAQWLACTDEVCVPEQGMIAVDLTVGDGRIDPAARAQFDAWRAKLPRPLGAQARFEVVQGRMRIAVPLPADVPVSAPYFFPSTEGAIDYAAPQSVSRNGDALIVETTAKGQPNSLSGVLKIDDDTGLSLEAVPGPVPPAGEPIGKASAARWDAMTVLTAFAGAVLGGLLLNVMPCVFPILSLKALGLARAGVDEREARREGLAYAAGVIATCLALGGALLALRAGGAAVGWAFQLQDPRVIGLLLLLTTGVALNLAGLFELRTIGAGDALAARGGPAGAFWTGALAAFVATPCTGPFMAAALGAALVLPAAGALAVFGGLGLGLALPFLAIGFVPALRRLLPKPGAWMETMRHILSVPMFLTALGLAWILGRQAGVNGMAVGLGAALLLGLGLWWAGVRQMRGRPILPVIPAAAIAAGLVLTLAPVATRAEAGGLLKAQPFSEAALKTARDAGRPVFLYFTADWCLSCKVNEKGAIERSEVADAFAKHNVAVLVGDWTNGDPTIGRFLEAHGRSGVPLYLFYRPGAPEPDVLPQVLTPGMLARLAS